MHTHKQKKLANSLTDEEVLSEFVKRFQCDAAVLIYLDGNSEFGFARWNNGTGRKWANSVFSAVQQNVLLETTKSNTKDGLTVQLQR